MRHQSEVRNQYQKEGNIIVSTFSSVQVCVMLFHHKNDGEGKRIRAREAYTLREAHPRIIILGAPTAASFHQQGSGTP